MFHLTLSNRFELLLQALHERMEADPDTSPLAPRRIIIPSLAVRRAITLDTAERYGICTNLEFAYLAQWLWQAMASLIPGIASDTPFDAKVLTWRMERHFGDPSFAATHDRIGPYLKASDDAMRFELATRVAERFEQYTTYRPDWLQAWGQGRPVRPPGKDPASARLWQQDETWQRALWQRLTQDLQAATDDPVERFVAAVQRDPQAARKILPSKVHVFAQTAIAPQHLLLLRALATVMDVHVYALNPCQAYWFDIVSEKRRARLQARGQALHTDVGHPLLAAWGQQTQAQLALLIEQMDDAVDPEDVSLEPSGGHRLARLQRAVLNLDAPDTQRNDTANKTTSSPDTSIEVHVCHSLRRELETLHNRLLALFAQADAPRPDEVLVVTPAIDKAAPLIDAVFGTARGKRSIAYTVTGRALGGDGGAAAALMALIDLGSSRIKASALMDMLQMPLITQALRWSSDEAAVVQQWLQEAGMRWGLDGVHRASFGVPALEQHTLDDALDRLMLGALMPDTISQDDHEPQLPFLGKLPAGHAVGSQTAWLGTLELFASRLAAWRQSLAVAKTPEAWHQALVAATDNFFAASTPTEMDGLRALRMALSQWRHQTDAAEFDQPISTAVMRAALVQQLQARAPGGVPSGSVTFASMSALRSLPYRVIAVIGLNDSDYPTAKPALEFDLMAQAPRLGDRQGRLDERNVMLDLLLAARERLWLSYVGRHVHSNAELPPSVVLSELLDALARADGVDVKTLQQQIVVEQPLQPFAPELFAPKAPEQRRSYHQTYADALRIAAQHQATLPAPSPSPSPSVSQDDGSDDDGDLTGEDNDGDTPETVVVEARDATPLFKAPLPAVPAALRDINLNDLKRFFTNPAQHLLRTRLGLSLPRLEEEALDDEPFALDPRQRTAMAKMLLSHAARGARGEALTALARAGTAFPAGAMGDAIIQREVRTIQRQLAAVAKAGVNMRLPQQVLSLSVDQQAWTLALDLHKVQSTGLAHLSPSKLRAHDKLLAWIDHLALGVLAPDGVAKTTRWVARDKVLTYKPIGDPQAALGALVQAYAQGLLFPLAMMPASSLAALEPQPEAAVRKAWAGDDRRPGDAADAHVQLAWRGMHALVHDASFEPLAQRLLAPLVEALTVEDL